MKVKARSGRDPASLEGLERLDVLGNSQADEEAQEDIINMVSSANSGAVTFWMSKYSTEVQLGHSTVRYMAEKGNIYHRRQIVFLGDRAPKRDPHSYAVPKDERKKWIVPTPRFHHDVCR